MASNPGVVVNNLLFIASLWWSTPLPLATSLNPALIPPHLSNTTSFTIQRVRVPPFTWAFLPHFAYFSVLFTFKCCLLVQSFEGSVVLQIGQCWSAVLVKLVHNYYCCRLVVKRLGAGCPTAFLKTVQVPWSLWDKNEEKRFPEGKHRPLSKSKWRCQ